MKEKIEDKLQYIKDAGFELTDYETVDMLYTLIQAERKEAVEGFVKYWWEREKEQAKANVDKSMEEDILAWYLHYAEEYLQSLDKGDTDENR